MTSVADRRLERVGGRVPPHSIESEESVLGAILMSVDAANQVMDRLGPDDFYVPAHQAIFRAVRTLYDGNQAIDAITVSEELRRSSELERVGGLAYITRLLDVVPSAANVDYYADTVAEHAQRRALIRAGSEITDLAIRLDDEIHAIIDRAEQTVLAVAERRMGDSMVPIGPLFFTTLEELEALEAQGSDVTGLSTGFRDLDSKLTGLHPANLMIVAARPAMGKCLVGDTRVVDSKTGSLVRIADLAGDPDLASRFHVLALDRSDGAFAQAEVGAAASQGIRHVFAVTTGWGRQVVATANHPLLTKVGWRRIDELAVGDEVMVPRRTGVFGVDALPEPEVVRLGYLLGHHACQANQGDHQGDGIEIPEAVFRLPEPQLATFLSSLFAAGGSSAPNRVGFATSSTQLGEDVQHLLTRFGVLCRRTRRPVGLGWDLVVDDPVSLAVFDGWGYEDRVSDNSGSTAAAVPEVCWDLVVAIEPAGEKETFDLEVPIHANFVAGDVVVHNSALTANIATNVAMTGQAVAVFSLEMSKEEIAQRMLCSVARIDSMKLRTGRITEAVWPRLTEAASRLYNAPVFVDDSPIVTVTDIRAKCRRLKRARGLALIVVDYIQLMQGPSRENRQQEIAEISRSLKNLARELEIPVIAVSQLNRNLESREDKRPRLGDLRESGSLEQDADIVLFIYRDEYYHEATDKKGVAEVIIAKHRAGSTGTVEMTFMPEFTKFSDIGRD